MSYYPTCMLYAELAIASGTTWYELAKGLNQAATPPFTVEPCLARCGETFHNFPIHLRGKVPEPGELSVSPDHSVQRSEH